MTNKKLEEEKEFTKVEDLPLGVELESFTNRGIPITFTLRNSLSKYIGQIYEANSGIKYKVLGNLDKRYKSNNQFLYFLIEFTDSTRQVVLEPSIYKGKIENPNTPSVFGKGYMGQGVHKSKENYKVVKEYLLWKNMMERCYSKKYHERFPSYKYCEVETSWLNYQNFYESIQNVEGYSLWKNNSIPRKYNLDKDIKIEGNKLYSEDTCMFVTAFDNISKVSKGKENVYSLTGKVYEGTNSKTMDVEVFRNQTAFANKHNLARACVSNCLAGKQSYTGDWTFRTLTDKEVQALDKK